MLHYFIFLYFILSIYYFFIDDIKYECTFKYEQSFNPIVKYNFSYSKL